MKYIHNANLSSFAWAQSNYFAGTLRRRFRLYSCVPNLGFGSRWRRGGGGGAGGAGGGGGGAGAGAGGGNPLSAAGQGGGLTQYPGVIETTPLKRKVVKKTANKAFAGNISGH